MRPTSTAASTLPSPFRRGRSTGSGSPEHAVTTSKPSPFFPDTPEPRMKFPYSFPLARAFCLYLGQAAFLAWEMFCSIFAGRIRWGIVLHQIVEIGFGSQAVVIITGIFTGAVFTAQIFFQFNALNMSTAVGPVVSIALCRELGPVLTGLMVAGRVGAAMSAEIGTMKVTEQIDALRALAVNPIDYLVVPRAVAMMISMPLLVLSLTHISEPTRPY